MAAGVNEKEQAVVLVSYETAADHSADRGKAVGYDGALVADATAPILGCIVRGEDSGHMGSAAISGLVLAKANAAITRGARCIPVTGGLWDDGTISDGTYFHGYAATAAAAQNEFFVLDLCRNIFVGDAVA